jgi:hypothetical protein
LKLSFEGVHNDAEWSYFRLELTELEHCGVYEAGDGADYVRTSEEITEIDNETDAERSCWDEGQCDGENSPKMHELWFVGFPVRL